MFHPMIMLTWGAAITIKISFLGKNLRKKSSWPHVALDLARVEKGEVIPDNVAPKSDFLF